MTNRRLIAMIRGRAAAGDPLEHVPLAARPQVTRALSNVTLAVGSLGVTCAVLAGASGGLISAAADAAVGAGGGATRVATAPEAVPMAGLAASDPVDLATAELMSLSTDVGAPALVAGDLGSSSGALQGVVAPTSTASAPVVTARTTAPPPQPVSVPEPGTVEAIIVEVFGAHANAAIGVARCESRLNPAAVSRGGGNWGLFQINTAHRSRVSAMGYQWEDLLDARVNSLVAKSIFDEQGWRPWGCRHAAS